METNKKKWRYMSTVLGGNLHDAAHFISKFHPEWDVVAMDSGGGATSVVYREEIVYQAMQPSIRFVRDECFDLPGGDHQ